MIVPDHTILFCEWSESQQPRIADSPSQVQMKRQVADYQQIIVRKTKIGGPAWGGLSRIRVGRQKWHWPTLSSSCHFPRRIVPCSPPTLTPTTVHFFHLLHFLPLHLVMQFSLSTIKSVSCASKQVCRPDSSLLIFETVHMDQKLKHVGKSISRVFIHDFFIVFSRSCEKDKHALQLWPTFLKDMSPSHDVWFKFILKNRFTNFSSFGEEFLDW